MELIAEQGAEQTSLAQIGERAGFSRGIVNHHFGTKAELIKRLVSQAQRGFAGSLPPDTAKNGLDALLALVDSYIAPLKGSDARHRAFLVMWAEAAGAGRDVRPSFVEGDRRFRAGIQELVERGIRDGSIRAEADAVAFAAALVAQLRGVGIELLIDEAAFKVDRVRKEIVRSITASLAAPRRRAKRTG
jgi:AcrR family transcriptional regulator